MANLNVNESIRKPRRAKGTLFFVQRNYYAAGVIAVGGLCWGLYELWPEARKLKRSQIEDGKFDTPPEIAERFRRANLALNTPTYERLVAKLHEREEEKEDAVYRNKEKPQPWYIKLFYSKPEL